MRDKPVTSIPNGIMDVVREATKTEGVVDISINITCNRAYEQLPFSIYIGCDRDMVNEDTESEYSPGFGDFSTMESLTHDALGFLQQYDEGKEE